MLLELQSNLIFFPGLLPGRQPAVAVVGGSSIVHRISVAVSTSSATPEEVARRIRTNWGKLIFLTLQEELIRFLYSTLTEKFFFLISMLYHRPNLDLAVLVGSKANSQLKFISTYLVR